MKKNSAFRSLFIKETAEKQLCSTPVGQRRPRGRLRTRWRDYVEHLTWHPTYHRLGIPSEHLPFIAEDRDGGYNSSNFARDPQGYVGIPKCIGWLNLQHTTSQFTITPLTLSSLSIHHCPLRQKCVSPSNHELGSCERVVADSFQSHLLSHPINDSR